MRAQSTSIQYALIYTCHSGHLANPKPSRFESSGSVQLILSTMLSHAG